MWDVLAHNICARQTLFAAAVVFSVSEQICSLTARSRRNKQACKSVSRRANSWARRSVVARQLQSLHQVFHRSVSSALQRQLAWLWMHEQTRVAIPAQTERPRLKAVMGKHNSEAYRQGVGQAEACSGNGAGCVKGCCAPQHRQTQEEDCKGNSPHCIKQSGL